MNLNLDISLAKGYSSNSQIVRVLTENWVLNNSYCPNCGSLDLKEFENNRPVADFYCEACAEEFELKSKSGKLSATITDGAYSTMIERINSKHNPNFLFLTYSGKWTINDFLIIPKHFFTPEIIVKRPPLAATARRAGWVGCNIDVSKIADAGKIFLVKNSHIINQEIVRETYRKTLFLRTKGQAAKGWLLDIMSCIDQIKMDVFTLGEVYKFEDWLKQKHPSNKFIKDKIRQQLQVLRDKGFIEFTNCGSYKKIKYGSI